MPVITDDTDWCVCVVLRTLTGVCLSLLMTLTGVCVITEDTGVCVITEDTGVCVITEDTGVCVITEDTDWCAGGGGRRGVGQISVGRTGVRV